VRAAPSRGGGNNARMRCGFCGADATRERPMLGLGGLAICEDCTRLASDFFAKLEISAPAPSRPGWQHAWPDPEALRTADAADLASEVALLREVIAPIEQFLRGADAALSGASPQAIAVAVGRHVHRTPVELADGTTVTAVSFLAGDPYTRDTSPVFGLYLDACWAPPWPHEHLAWPDFGLPSDVDGLRAALEGLLGRARRGELVEIGCLGGHGRTGTALACLAVLAGTPRQAAVDWVRGRYCSHAVETDEQRALNRALRRLAVDREPKVSGRVARLGPDGPSARLSCGLRPRPGIPHNHVKVSGHGTRRRAHGALDPKYRLN